MLNSIYIVINGLELAFQSHEGVGTEDFYLSQTLGHGRCLRLYNLVQYEVAKVADEL